MSDAMTLSDAVEHLDRCSYADGDDICGRAIQCVREHARATTTPGDDRGRELADSSVPGIDWATFLGHLDWVARRNMTATGAVPRSRLGMVQAAWAADVRRALAAPVETEAGAGGGARWHPRHITREEAENEPPGWSPGWNVIGEVGADPDPLVRQRYVLAIERADDGDGGECPSWLASLVAETLNAASPPAQGSAETEAWSHVRDIAATVSEIALAPADQGPALNALSLALRRLAATPSAPEGEAGELRIERAGEELCANYGIPRGDAIEYAGEVARSLREPLDDEPAPAGPQAEGAGDYLEELRARLEGDGRDGPS